MKKTLMIVLATLMAAPLFAQEGAAAATAAAGMGRGTLGVLAACLAMAFASGICGLGQGKAIAAACEGAARNPGLADKLQLMMIIGLVFIESLALYTLLIVVITK